MLLMTILSQILFNENVCMTFYLKREIKSVNIELLQSKILTNDNDVLSNPWKKNFARVSKKLTHTFS